MVKSFIPVADHVGVGKGGPPEEGEIFKKVAQGQGIYACTPSGILLEKGVIGSPEYGNLDKIAAKFKEWTAKYEKMSKAERLLAKAPAKALGGSRYAELYPEGGLVLQVQTRDLPRKPGDVDVTPKTASECGKGSKIGAGNWDWAWFRKDEVRAMLPSDRTAGARHRMPESLVRRLAMHHMIDNVLGQLRPFGPDEIKKAELTFVVERVEGSFLHMRLEGATKAERQKDGQFVRSYEASLLGRCAYDVSQEKFTLFDLLAVGMRAGARAEGAGGPSAGDVAPNPMGVGFFLPKAGPPISLAAPVGVRKYGARYFN